MIPLPLGDLFSLYLSLFLITLAYLWFRDERRRAPDDWTIAKEHLYICPRCHLSFLAKDDSANITRCPRCNEMCFLKKKKRFRERFFFV